jgi:hypothetical protein
MAISLDDLSTDPTVAPPRIVLYGPHGIGKTTFGAGAPGPVVLPFEDGLGKLEVTHFPLLGSYGEAMEALAALYTGDHDFRTLVIDTVDWLEPLIWAETCRKEGWPNIESPGWGKGYVAALDQWRAFLEGINALRHEKRMTAVLLAHTEIRRFDAPDSEPYDRYQIKLQPRASALLEEWADAVLFANFRTFTAKSDVGFNKQVTRGVGAGERLLFSEERPAHKAKNRYGLPPELPFAWGALEDALAGDQPHPSTQEEAA